MCRRWCMLCSTCLTIKTASLALSPNHERCRFLTAMRCRCSTVHVILTAEAAGSSSKSQKLT